MQKSDEIMKDYYFLDELSKSQKLSDDFIFKKIAELDKKYNNCELHYNSFEGLLSNIGADQKSVTILNCVIKRLKSKKGLPKSKYHYDLANTILAKAEIEFKSPDDFDFLLNSDNFREAKNEFMLVEKNDSTHFERAGTNIANILEKYGRNYEALFAYDKVLKYNPKFGMALGNKAIALQYYISLAPQQSLLLLTVCHDLLIKALNDKEVSNIGGKSAFEHFEKTSLNIEKYFKEIGYRPQEVHHPSDLSDYQKFIINNNLFLNYDFGYYYDNDSLKDNLFPCLLEEISSEKFEKSSVMNKKTYFTFQVFNQIIEDFTTSRYNFFKALNSKYDDIDEKINYIYTFDYTCHCLEHGLLKSVFCVLYNILDKLAHLVKYYFFSSEINESNVTIYFDWLTTDEFKKIIKQKKNYQLVALFCLAIDFKTNGPYYKLNQIRNRITHSFLNINVEIGYDPKYQHFEIRRKDFIDNITELFLIVKSAIIYAITAINLTSSYEKTVPMNVTFQNTIFRSEKLKSI